MDFVNILKLRQNKLEFHSIKIEILMGHSLGVSDSYVRFTEEQMLEEYLQVVEYLTVNQNVVLINKSHKKTGRNYPKIP